MMDIPNSIKNADREVNGGYALVPVEPRAKMISWMETGYLDPEPPTQEAHVKHIYHMIIQAVQESE